MLACLRSWYKLKDQDYSKLKDQIIQDLGPENGIDVTPVNPPGEAAQWVEL